MQEKKYLKVQAHCRSVPDRRIYTPHFSFCVSPLQVALLTVSLVYYVYHIHHSIIIMDAVEQLHRHRGHVEVSTLASWEQVSERVT